MPYKDIEHGRARARRYYWQNRDTRLSYGAQRYATKADEINSRRRVARAADPEGARAKERAYHGARPDQRRAQNKRSYDRHPDERRAYARERRSRLKAEGRPFRVPIEYARDWRRRHREELNAAGAARRRAHPEIHAAHQARRRARKTGNGGSHTLKEWLEKLELFGGCCAYCGRSDRPLCRDHRVPLCRGGTDDISNIVPACRPCNSAKHKQTDREYLGLAA